MGERLGFASNKPGTTASSNATQRRAESCVSRYFGAADLTSWAAALTSIAKAKWAVQAAKMGRDARGDGV